MGPMGVVQPDGYSVCFVPIALYSARVEYMVLVGMAAVSVFMFVSEYMRLNPVTVTSSEEADDQGNWVGKIGRRSLYL